MRDDGALHEHHRPEGNALMQRQDENAVEDAEEAWNLALERCRGVVDCIGEDERSSVEQRHPGQHERREQEIGRHRRRFRQLRAEDRFYCVRQDDSAFRDGHIGLNLRMARLAEAGLIITGEQLDGETLAGN